MASYFKNHFLVAMPGLEDPSFEQTVTYICEHHQGGAMGIVINQPITITVGELFGQLELDVSHLPIGEQPLYYGGPVQKERGFVLHSASLKKWESTLPVSNDIHITGSSDIFKDMAADQGPEHSLIALGYAGWDKGQLESEVADNRWLIVPGDAEILFETAHQERWLAAAKKLGVDLNLMGGQSGHA